MSSVLVLAVLVLLGAVMVGVLLLVLVTAARRTGERQVAQPGATPRAHPPGPAAVPLREETVVAVSGLLRRGRKIQAIKVLRDATGLDLKSAKARVDGWSDVVELDAVRSGPFRDEERLKVEAAAVVAASGWHVADAFLREQRGLTPEASRAVLDSVS